MMGFVGRYASLAGKSCCCGRSWVGLNRSLAKRMGRRLKVSGRGWCVDHLEGMSALIATAGTPEWDSLWAQNA